MRVMGGKKKLAKAQRQANQIAAAQAQAQQAAAAQANQIAAQAAAQAQRDAAARQRALQKAEQESAKRLADLERQRELDSLRTDYIDDTEESRRRRAGERKSAYGFVRPTSSMLGGRSSNLG